MPRQPAAAQMRLSTPWDPYGSVCRHAKFECSACMSCNMTTRSGARRSSSSPMPGCTNQAGRCVSAALIRGDRWACAGVVSVPAAVLSAHDTNVAYTHQRWYCLPQRTRWRARHLQQRHRQVCHVKYQGNRMAKSESAEVVCIWSDAQSFHEMPLDVAASCQSICWCQLQIAPHVHLKAAD
jgi:hypothetical protein